MNYQKYETWAQIITAVTAVLGVIWFSVQFDNDRANRQFNSVASYAQLTSACKQQISKPPPSSVQIKLWDDLCEARVLSHEIVINDLIRATESHSLINLVSARELSVQLEDGLVRELKVRALSFVESKRQKCIFTDDELHRVQEVFKAIYMFDKPKKNFENEISAHKENKDDSEHAAAFLAFAAAVQDIGISCHAKP